MRALRDYGRPFWRRRLLVPFLVLLGANLVVFLGYTLPRALRDRSAAARLSTLREEVGRQRALAQGLERRAETVRRNADDTQRFYGEVLGTREARLVPLLREIEKTARDLGLGAGQAGYDPSPVRDAPLVRFVITMPVSGSYQQLVSFLDRLERSPQFLIVDSVALREKQGEAAEADLSVALSTYFRSEQGGGRGR